MFIVSDVILNVFSPNVCICFQIYFFFETLRIIKDEHIELTLLLCNYMFNICKVLYYIMPLMSMYCQM